MYQIRNLISTTAKHDSVTRAFLCQFHRVVQVHSSGNLPLLGRATCKPRVPILWPRRAHQQRGTTADRRIRATCVHSALRIDAWHRSLYRTWSCLRDFGVSLTSTTTRLRYTRACPTLIKTARVFREEHIFNRYVSCVERKIWITFREKGTVATIKLKRLFILTLDFHFQRRYFKIDCIIKIDNSTNSWKGWSVMDVMAFSFEPSWKNSTSKLKLSDHDDATFQRLLKWHYKDDNLNYY